MTTFAKYSYLVRLHLVNSVGHSRGDALAIVRAERVFVRAHFDALTHPCRAAALASVRHQFN